MPRFPSKERYRSRYSAYFGCAVYSLLYSDANIFLEDEKKFIFHCTRINGDISRINFA